MSMRASLHSLPRGRGKKQIQTYLLVGKHQHNGVPELVFGQHAVQLLLGTVLAALAVVDTLLAHTGKIEGDGGVGGVNNLRALSAQEMKDSHTSSLESTTKIIPCVFW